MITKRRSDKRWILALVCAIALGLMLAPALLPDTQLLGVDWTDYSWSLLFVPMLWALIVTGLAAFIACALGIEPDHHATTGQNGSGQHAYGHVRRYRDHDGPVHLSKGEMDRIRNQMARNRHIEC